MILQNECVLYCFKRFGVESISVTRINRSHLALP